MKPSTEQEYQYALERDRTRQRLKAGSWEETRARELEIARQRKQEFGELTGRAIYSREAKKELEEKEETLREARERAEKKHRPGWEPEALAKEEKERKKIEQERSYRYALEEDRVRQRLWAKSDLARQQEFPQAKMGWGIFLVALVLSLIADIAELLTVGTLGWFVGFVIDLILLVMLGFSKAGRKQWKKWVWGPIIEKVPILAAVPLFRAAFLTWAFISSRSTTLQAVSKMATSGVAKS